MLPTINDRPSEVGDVHLKLSPDVFEIANRCSPIEPQDVTASAAARVSPLSGLPPDFKDRM